MKVVLLKDIPKVGKKHQVLEVADGFARNVLLKQGQAMMATVEALKKVESIEKQKVASDLHNARAFEALAKDLSQVVVLIKAKTNSEGHLFAGLKTKDIVEALKHQTGIVVSENALELPKPIKTKGDYTLKLTNGQGGLGRLETDLKILVN